MSTILKTTKTWRNNIVKVATQTSHGKANLSKIYASTDSAGISLEFRQFDDLSLNCKPALLRRPEWEDKEYREAYMEAAIEQGIAWQIRINRKLRGWSQRELASILGTGQSAVSRLEDPSYGKHSLETLLKVANAFDCALTVKMVSFSELAYSSERLDEAQQCAVPYFIEREQLDGNQEETDGSESSLSGRTHVLRRSAGNNSHRSVHHQDHIG